MDQKMSSRVLLSAPVALACWLAPAALASDLEFQSSTRRSRCDSGASYCGRLSYESESSTRGLLTVRLRNTSPERLDGYINKFVVRVHSEDHDASITLISSTEDVFENSGPRSFSDFGSYDGGAVADCDDRHGDDCCGLAPGEVMEMRFRVRADDADELQAEDFFRAGSSRGILVGFCDLDEAGCRDHRWDRDGTDLVPNRLESCDWNDDGRINASDFFDYLEDFFELEADYDCDGGTNIKDFFDFLRCFFEHE